MSTYTNRRQFLRRSATAVAGCAGGYLAANLYVPPLVRAAEAEWGSLTGRLVYDGDPPPREKLVVDKDVECCGKFDIRDESLMVGDDGGLMNTYIYCRDRSVDVCPELTESADEFVLLDNRDCIFMPHCMMIWLDRQKLRIVNSDPVAQNVAFSPFGDRAANIILPPPPAEAAEAVWTFGRSQRKPVPIACNYHPWESAYILPRDNPYMAFTGEDGTFRIDKLPVGPHEFQAWHERPGYLDAPDWRRGRFEVDVRAGVNDLGTIRLSPELFEQG